MQVSAPLRLTAASLSLKLHRADRLLRKQAVCSWEDKVPLNPGKLLSGLASFVASTRALDPDSNHKSDLALAMYGKTRQACALAPVLLNNSATDCTANCCSVAADAAQRHFAVGVCAGWRGQQ